MNWSELQQRKVAGWPQHNVAVGLEHSESCLDDPATHAAPVHLQYGALRYFPASSECIETKMQRIFFGYK